MFRIPRTILLTVIKINKIRNQISIGDEIMYTIKMINILLSGTSWAYARMAQGDQYPPDICLNVFFSTKAVHSNIPSLVCVCLAPPPPPEKNPAGVIVVQG